MGTSVPFLYAMLMVMSVKMDDLADNLPAPTKEDKQRIQRIILRYEKKHPGYIQQAIEEARRDQREMHRSGTDVSKFGEVGKQAGQRHLLELPEELHIAITRAYPTMFTSKKHFRWFLKNFRELVIPEKI